MREISFGPKFGPSFKGAILFEGFPIFALAAIFSKEQNNLCNIGNGHYGEYLNHNM